MKQVELNFLLTAMCGGNPQQYVFAFSLLYVLELLSPLTFYTNTNYTNLNYTNLK